MRGIEGLRALAACSILVYHSWLYSAPGGRPLEMWPLTAVLPDFAFGVVLFFTLSGFLLYRPYVASILSERPLPSARRYLRNRALRILPAYVAILFIVSLVFRSALSRDASGHLHNGALTDPGLLARTVFLVQDYLPGSTLSGIGPAWSLAIEVVFYVVLPALGLLAWLLARSWSGRAGRRLALLTPAALLLVIGISGKLAANHLLPPVRPFDGWEADWHSVLERSFLANADLFAFGMALAVLRVEVEQGRERFSRLARMFALPLGLLAYLGTAAMTGRDEQLSYSFYNTLMAFACTCLLALVVLPPRRATPGPLVRILETRVFVWGGLISYSVFLWHEPLVRWLHDHDLTADGWFGFGMNTLALLAVTAGLSTLTYRYVELPALRRKAPARGRRVPAVPAEQAQAAP